MMMMITISELAQLGWCRAAAASVGARPAPQQPPNCSRVQNRTQPKKTNPSADYLDEDDNDDCVDRYEDEDEDVR